MVAHRAVVVLAAAPAGRVGRRPSAARLILPSLAATVATVELVATAEPGNLLARVVPA